MSDAQSSHPEEDHPAKLRARSSGPAMGEAISHKLRPRFVNSRLSGLAVDAARKCQLTAS